MAMAIREPGLGGKLIMVCPTCHRKVTCGNCNSVLEARKGAWHNRRVPRKGGKLCAVCPECASEIDRQVSFDIEALEDELVAALPTEGDVEAALPTTEDDDYWKGF